MNGGRTALYAGFALFACTAAAVSVRAAAPPSAIARCIVLEDDRARLACYDGLFRGASEPKVAVFGLEGRNTRGPETLEAIRSRITAVERQRDGALVVTLENGQVWRQMDDLGRARWSAGDTFLVERAALGSFMAKVESSGRSFRVRRER